MSALVRVRISVEPNKVLQTSPERFAGGENMFMRKYPTAKAPTEIIATLASPLIFEFSLAHKIKMAHRTVTGKTKTVLFVIFNTDAIAMAPKAV